LLALGGFECGIGAGELRFHLVIVQGDIHHSLLPQRCLDHLVLILLFFRLHRCLHVEFVFVGLNLVFDFDILPIRVHLQVRIRHIEQTSLPPLFLPAMHQRRLLLQLIDFRLLFVVCPVGYFDPSIEAHLGELGRRLQILFHDRPLVIVEGIVKVTVAVVQELANVRVLLSFNSRIILLLQEEVHRII